MSGRARTDLALATARRNCGTRSVQHSVVRVVAKAMEAAGMSERQLCFEVGLNRTTWRRILRDNGDNMKLVDLFALIRFFGADFQREIAEAIGDRLAPYAMKETVDGHQAGRRMPAQGRG
jgi:hypothetical protein